MEAIVCSSVVLYVQMLFVVALVMSRENVSCVFRSSIIIFGKFETRAIFSVNPKRKYFFFCFISSVLLAAMTRPIGSVCALEHEEKEYITAS